MCNNGLGNIKLKDVADYLGHNEKIHLDHSRHPSTTKDIIIMLNILENVQENKKYSENDLFEIYMNENIIGSSKDNFVISGDNYLL